MPDESLKKTKSEPNTARTLRWGLGVLGAVVLSMVALCLFPTNKAPVTEVRISSASLQAEIAATPTARQQGLSGRDNLAKNEALLFVFDHPDTHGFWMRDMEFAIDIIWLNSAREVVHIEESVAPDTYPEVFRPNEPALYVIEIAASQSQQYGIEVGDKAEFEL